MNDLVRRTKLPPTRRERKKHLHGSSFWRTGTNMSHDVIPFSKRYDVGCWHEWLAQAVSHMPSPSRFDCGRSNLEKVIRDKNGIASSLVALLCRHPRRMVRLAPCSGGRWRHGICTAPCPARVTRAKGLQPEQEHRLVSIDSSEGLLSIVVN